MSTWNFAVVLMVLMVTNTCNLRMLTFCPLIGAVSCYVLWRFFSRRNSKVRTGSL